ncbi:MAG TPA: type II secretion system inner membrane protein GspF [Chiayiivirga sp.]|jgi:general secretion pathway protein F|uniref:Type II secretion system inner membrane protein GspF n=1 Tax=Denitratimonas tolerans TaxID=1338420 RepID=A0AAW9R290_9GAMM|nr:type II secretion system inner membrane protein GspF [Chiayiivirga sp.]MEB2314533.1 type II secretion system inner membrane protein GspF [Xanthomonadaceae bacterium]HRN58905.1 type II secretion system inner membrane protein GspF [Chiayiivirga sp.]HRO86495.1 type II secretion system inner membrane protein GspF [Chiayiivirga sp.]
MPHFRYKALSTAGDPIEGVMEAASAEEVIVRLQDAGNLPLDARPADDSGGSLAALFRRAPMKGAQVLQFTQQLATLLGAGQPLDRALQILLDLPDSPEARRVIERVRDAVRGGTPLSQALEQEEGVFSRLYVNMVRAGEAGGSLHDTLKRLAEYLERSKALRESVINALIYPSILVLMVFGALLLLLGYVVPQFLPLFEDMDVEMPLLTQVVMALGNFVSGYWWLLLAGLVAGFMLLRRRLADPQTRRGFDAWVLRRGLVGGLVARLETARLARTLGTLVHNGVPLLTALSIARNVMGNLALSDAVEAASAEVKTGGGLAQALGRSKLFPRLALQMVAVGEESGDLDTMLTKVADTFDQEVKNTVERLLAALVPTVTVFMAAAVALIMMAILIPIFSLTNAVG